MRQMGRADPLQAALGALENEELAARTVARLLITAANGGVETVARRVHGGSRRAACPFVRVWAGDFPIDPLRLKETCVTLLDAAPGGSMFIATSKICRRVFRMCWSNCSPNCNARAPPDAVRVMTGTSVSLLDRIAAGTFSERLFYRLNLIHLVVPDGAPWVDTPASFADI